MDFNEAFEIARRCAQAAIANSEKTANEAQAFKLVMQLLNSAAEPQRHIAILEKQKNQLGEDIAALEKSKDQHAHSLAVLQHQITEANQKIVDLQKDCEAAEKIIQKGATAARILAKIHQGENAIGLTRELTILLNS